jgi:uncharacterized membrane protein
MTNNLSSNWPRLAILGAMVGIGIVAIPAGLRGVASARGKGQKSADSAPGYTARRSFGDYAVVGRTVTIGKPRSELFRFWRDFSNLPRVMENLVRVENHADGRSTWHICDPAGDVHAIETTIAREIENELIAWRSTPESPIDTEGRVAFHDAPGDRGTRVSLIVAYKLRGGMVGSALAKLAQKGPEIQARRDLKRFKMLMETGEVATADRRGKAEPAFNREEEMA